MATLQIRKKTNKTWVHIDSTLGEFILSKFYFSADDGFFQIIEEGQSKRRKYNVLDITVFDDTALGTPETFANITVLSQRLEALFYPAFGAFLFSSGTSNYIMNNANFSVSGNDFTFNANWNWYIGGFPFTNPDPVVVNVPYATTGRVRIDLIVCNTSGTFQRVIGTEVTSNPFAPIVPFNTVQVTFIQVSDSSFGIIVIPSGSDFIKKTSKRDNYITDSGAVENLTIEIGRKYIFTNASSFGGFTNISPLVRNADLILYDNEKFTLKNESGLDITLLNESVGSDLPLFFYDGNDFILKDNETVDFIYANSRFECVGLFQPILASGTNIKTVNGTSILGSGDLVVSGGEKSIYASYPTLNLTNLNTWRTWGRSSSIMNVDTNQSMGTGSVPTIVGITGYGDSNYFLVKDWISLTKMTLTVRENISPNVTMEILVKSFDLTNGFGRGDETNGQLLINETINLGELSGNFIKDNFTIASHSFNSNTIIHFFYRITSGTGVNIQGVSLKLTGS